MGVCNGERVRGEACSDQGSEFKLQGCTNTAWAFALVNNLKGELLAAEARGVEWQASELKPQKSANTGGGIFGKSVLRYNPKD